MDLFTSIHKSIKKKFKKYPSDVCVFVGGMERCLLIYLMQIIILMFNAQNIRTPIFAMRFILFFFPLGLLGAHVLTDREMFERTIGY